MAAALCENTGSAVVVIATVAARVFDIFAGLALGIVHVNRVFSDDNANSNHDRKESSELHGSGFENCTLVLLISK